AESQTSMLERRATLTLGATSLDRLRVHSDAQWLSAEALGVERGRANLRVVIDTKKLAGMTFPVSCDLLLATNPTETPVRLRVVVARSRGYTVEPPLLTCTRNGTATATVTPAARSGTFSVPRSSEIALLSAPTGMSVDGVDSKDAAVKL